MIPITPLYNHYFYIMECDLSIDALTKEQLEYYESLIKSKCNKIEEPTAYKDGNKNHKIFKLSLGKNLSGIIEVRMKENLCHIHAKISNYTTDIHFPIDSNKQEYTAVIPMNKDKIIVMINHFEKTC